MRLYTHIKDAERRVIKNMYFSTISKREIAKNLDRHPSSIYREISRNRTKAYHDVEAQKLSESRRRKRFRKLDINNVLRLIVLYIAY